MSSSLSSNPDSSSTATSSQTSGRHSESTSSEAAFADHSSHSSSSGKDSKPDAMAVSAAHHHQGPWPPPPLPSHHHVSLDGQQRGGQEDGELGQQPNGQDSEGQHFSNAYHTHNTSAQHYQPGAGSSAEAQASGSNSVSGAQRSQYPSNAQASSRPSQIAESSSQSRPTSVYPSTSFDRSRQTPIGQANHAGFGGPNRDSSALPASHLYNASQCTFGGGAWNQSDASSRDVSATATPLSRQPMQSRYFGLGPTLQMQNSLADPAFFPGGVVPPQSTNAGGVDTSEGASGSKEVPGFSVELKARSFDHRGYPVYGGRAAPITGVIRMPKSDECDVTIKISAHTTTGSTAMVWDGIALQPAANGSERVVFSATDTFPASEGHVDYSRASSSAPSPTASSSSTKAFAESNNTEDGILVIPFTTNMPVGGSTRIVDGEVATVAVALPPSFEMSSEQDNKDKAVFKSMSEAAGAVGSSAASVRTKMTRMTATTVREAVEAGLRQVYRIGCFYRITFTLNPVGGKVQESGRKLAGALFGSKKSKAAKKLKGSRTLSIPFVFLGEIVSQPPIPSLLPPIRPAILKQPSQLLAPQWESDVATAQWSGKFFKTMKRNVQLELFLPSRTVQAPSVVPVLLIIRPEDPEMLPKPIAAASTSPVGSPRPGIKRGASEESATVLQNSRVPVLNSGNSGNSGPASTADSGLLTGPKAGPTEPRKQGDEAALNAQGSGLSNSMQSSMSISDSPAHATSASNHAAPSASGASHKDPPQRIHKKISRSTFSFNKRPESGISRASSDESSMSYTIRGGGAPSSVQGDGVAQQGLPALVRLSILQNVYYNSSNVNEPPKNKRRLMNVADLEEIDLGRLANEHGYGDLSLLYDVPNAVALVADAKVSGVRVLRGLLRIPREATPSFRVQGIEVKYAIKVDLLPFNSRAGAKPGSVVLPGRGNASTSFPASSASSMYHGPSSSPPVTPPYHPSPLTFGARGPAGAIKTSQQQQQQQTDAGPSASSQHPPSTSTSGSQTLWTPGAAVPFGLHSHTHDSSVRMSQSGSSSGTIGAGGSVAGGRGRTSFDTSEAGYSRRSPSDPTIIGGADSSKLQKTVGALWVNVRLVKGKGSL